MIVESRLYGVLRRYRPAGTPGAPHQPFQVHLPVGASIQSLVEHLGIPDGLVNAAAVNGQAKTTAALLSDGDKIALFPQSAGGQRH